VGINLKRGRRGTDSVKRKEDVLATAEDDNNAAVRDEAEYGSSIGDSIGNSNKDSGSSTNRDSVHSDGYNSSISVGDEQDQGNDGLGSLTDSRDGTWSDGEEKHISDAKARSDSRERLKEEITQHGAYRHYPNGDMDADDCPPNCSCIACGPQKGYTIVPQPNPRHYTRLNGRYTLDDCRPIDADEYDYYSNGNNSRVGCSDESKGDCREMDVDEVNFYSDGGNNSNVGCTDESDGYSSAGQYSSDESFGDG